eukprot:363985-Chlamydomonas_euryale.AAC.7
MAGGGMPRASAPTSCPPPFCCRCFVNVLASTSSVVTGSVASSLYFAAASEEPAHPMLAACRNCC